ncbi:hypothetical protein [Candidatus Electronema sp. PJ]|uniref:hypothetical protein n=1 Tax=Candidatus Electronema sp. PJ TaxID=3401572 RepID=UPI003AA86481
MIFSCSRTDRRGAAQPERSLFTFIFFLSFFLAVAGSASAGYGPNVKLIKDGGGTWGSILEMSVELHGSSARFTVRKKDGLCFNTESNISIRISSTNGKSLASEIVQLGDNSARLTVPLDDRSSTQSYYAYLFNSYGHAWVGPLKIGDSPDMSPEISHTDRPIIREDFVDYQPMRGSRLEPPRIDNRPRTVLVNEQVSIAVTVNSCRDGVQLQCFAEDSNQTRSNYYESERIWSDTTKYVSFSFNRPGIKTIFCKTRNNCCSSAWASRSLRVKERPNAPPQPPRISLDPATAYVNIPVRVPVLPGRDSDGDRVKVKCRAEDSDTRVPPGWFNFPQWTDVTFTFDKSGTKTISCVTVDQKGLESLRTKRSITVLDNTPDYKNSRTETKINISVETGPDGTNSKVKVHTSKSDDCAPFCNESSDITYDKPYLPEDYGYHADPAQEDEASYSPEPKDGDPVRDETIPDMP